MVLNLGNGQKSNVFVGEFIYFCVLKVADIFFLYSDGSVVYIKGMENLPSM
jgi:hypothetical protein